jgi:hypothetical protein
LIGIHFGDGGYIAVCHETTVAAVKGFLGSSESREGFILKVEGVVGTEEYPIE